MQGLNTGPRSNLSAAEVSATLQLRHGAKVRYGIDVLDAQENPTSNTLQIHPGGRVSWDFRVPDIIAGAGTSKAAVRRTASITVADVNFNLLTHRYLPWISMMSPLGNWVRWNLGVFVSVLPTRSYDGVMTTLPLELADKSHRYANRVLVNPLVVPIDTDSLVFVRNSLKQIFGESKFDFPTGATFRVTDDLFFEPGLSYLEVYNLVLENAGYDSLWITEEGFNKTRAVSEFGNKAVERDYVPGTTVLPVGNLIPLLPEVPNVLVFVSSRGPSLAEEGNGIRTVRNQSTGPGSINARGEEISLRIETEASTQVELDVIAFNEAQRYFAGGGLRYEGHVGLNPAHSDRDIVRFTKPVLGLTNTNTEWICTSWSHPFGGINSDSDPLTAISFEQRVGVS